MHNVTIFYGLQSGMGLGGQEQDPLDVTRLYFTHAKQKQFFCFDPTRANIALPLILLTRMYFL